MDRRQFLATVAKTVPALALGETMLLTGYAQTPSPGPRPAYTLPNRLPNKLSIGMFIWDWITMATPGEPYHDLERVMAGLRGVASMRSAPRRGSTGASPPTESPAARWSSARGFPAIAAI